MSFGKSIWAVAILITLLMAGCATDTREQLGPPGVHIYRRPQVWITHPAPTEAAADLPATETASSTTPTLGPDPLAWPTMSELEYEQYLADEIENLLTKMENKLDATNVNP